MQQNTFDTQDQTRFVPHSDIFCAHCEEPQRLLIPDTLILEESDGYCTELDWWDGGGVILCPTHGRNPHATTDRQPQSQPPTQPTRVHGDDLFTFLTISSLLAAAITGIVWFFVPAESYYHYPQFMLLVGVLCWILQSVAFNTYEP